jgi:HEAT repeat protein
MSRSARRSTPLLRSLAVGFVTASALAFSTGCGDENDPETHVKKLDDPATLPGAVNRLVQFFEDAMTRDNKDRNGPNVKPLLDKIIEPMTQKCVAGDLDERTNSKLIKFISDTRDPRGEACLIKALKDYKPDSTEEDIRWAARAVGAMKSKAAAGPLFDVFTKMKPSKPKASTIYLDVHNALVEVNDPSWEPQLITLLGHPINDTKDVATLKDEIFWQSTAAKLLGLQRSEKAVVPLLKVMLSPLKADVAQNAIYALTRIGKSAVQPTISLLQGESKELVEYAKVENLKGAGDKPSSEQIKAASSTYVSTAALVLATIGRQESAAPLLAALDKAEDVPRAIIARELTKLPKSPQILAAFEQAYEKTPVTLSIPPGMNARPMLAEQVGYFFDPSVVPWIVKTALETKGEEADVAPVRDASLLTALKLATADQFVEIDKLFSARTTGDDGKPTTVGKSFENEYKLAKDIATTCGAKVDCYLGKLGEPAAQAKETQFQGLKAAYMVGVLGKPEDRQKIVDLFPKLTNAAVRFISVTVVDSLSPKGDVELAGTLQKIVDDGEESKDQSRISGNAPFKAVIYRLNARAQ